MSINIRQQQSDNRFSLPNIEELWKSKVIIKISCRTPLTKWMKIRGWILVRHSYLHNIVIKCILVQERMFLGRHNIETTRW